MTLPFGLEWSATAAAAGSVVLRTTLLIVMTLAAAALLRRAAAGTRHVLLASGIAAALVVLPAVALTEWRLEVLPSSFGGTVQAPATRDSHTAERPHGPIEAAEGATVAEGAPAAGTSSGSVSTREPGAAAGTSAALVLLALWLIPALLLLLRLLHGSLTVRRIVATAQPLDGSAWTTPLYEAADCLDLADAPRLVRSDRVSMPFACGILRPTLVVPAGAEDWSDERRRWVLCHELAHVKRRDVLTHMLGRLACAVHWFNPLVWHAVRRLRAESERACDDLVLAAGARASDYADHLLQIVVRTRSAGVPAVALPLAVRREFEGRMLAILDTRTPRATPGLRQAASLAGLVAVAALLVAAAAPAPVRTAPTAAIGVTEDEDVASSSDVVADAERNEPAAAPVPAPAVTAPSPQPLSTEGPQPAGPVEPPQLAVPAQLGEPPPPRPTRTERAERPGTGSPLTDAAREALIRAARTDPSSRVRHGAVWALGNAGRVDAASVDAITAALAGDDDADVRETAAWALGHLRVVHREPALVRAAERDTDTRVRRTALWALGHLRSPEAVKPALLALRESDPHTRSLAAWAIGSTSPAERTPQLAVHLNDPDAAVRTAVAWALGSTRTTAAVPPLVAAFGTETDTGARDAMLWALYTMRRAVPESFFLGLLEHPDPQVRGRAPGLLIGSTPWPWPWPWPQPRPFAGS